jgi:hypothetical protein
MFACDACSMVDGAENKGRKTDVRQFSEKSRKHDRGSYRHARVGHEAHLTVLHEPLDKSFALGVVTSTIQTLIGYIAFYRL